MRAFAQFALTASVAAALLAGCGSSRPMIGAPGTLPQASALAAWTGSTKYKVLYTFGAPPDGNFPAASLIDVGGTLYGTTEYGGAGGSCDGTSSDGGTVFSITLSGKEKVLHSFAGNGTDGCNPYAGLIDVGGTLYGTTYGGGKYGCGYYSSANYVSCGTVFSIAPGGTEKVLHYFGTGWDDGNAPTAPVIDVNGTLYGTASQGGRHYCPPGQPGRCGTVFTVTLAGVERVLYDFRTGADGHTPVAALIHVGGRLYGTTYFGGNACGGYDGCGTVFSITPSGKEKTLHVFGSGSDGRFPNAGLIEVKGTFYGATRGGGSHSCNPYQGCGTIFSITATGTEKVLHSFDNTDGSTPQASLIDVKGMLYGTTSGGGADGKGTVFSISTTGKEKVLHSFSGGSDGLAPYAALLNVKGTLYGTTSAGFGFGGYGTVFALTP